MLEMFTSISQTRLEPQITFLSGITPEMLSNGSMHDSYTTVTDTTLSGGHTRVEQKLTFGTSLSSLNWKKGIKNRARHPQSKKQQNLLGLWFRPGDQQLSLSIVSYRRNVTNFNVVSLISCAAFDVVFSSRQELFAILLHCVVTLSVATGDQTDYCHYHYHNPPETPSPCR